MDTSFFHVYVQAFVCTSFSFLWGIYLGAESLHLIETLLSHVRNHPTIFQSSCTILQQFIPSTMYGGFNFSTSFCCFQSLSRVQLFATPWTVSRQAPLSMGFSRQEYWSGLPFPSPGDVPDPGIEPTCPALAGRFLTAEPPGKPQVMVYSFLNLLLDCLS